MILRRRAPRLPSEHAAHLPAGEEVLAGAELTDQAWAAATRVALYVLDAEGVRLRGPWHEIDTGTLDGESLVFSIIWADREREPSELPFASAEITRFTTVIRERIQHSVVHTETRRVSGTLVRATIRRDENGELYSRLTAFGPLRPEPQVQAEIDDLERQARQAAGLPD